MSNAVKRKLVSAVFSAILAGELAVVLDIVLVYNGKAQSVPKFAALVAVLFLLLLFFPGFRSERKRIVAVVCTAVLTVPLALGYFCWNAVSQSVV